MSSPTRSRREMPWKWKEDQENSCHHKPRQSNSKTLLKQHMLKSSLCSFNIHSIYSVNTCKTQSWMWVFFLLEFNYFTVFVLGSGAFKKAMLNLSRKFQQIFFKGNKIHFVQTTCRFSPHSTFISSHDSVLNKTAWSRGALFCSKWQRAMKFPCCLCNTW